MARRPRSTILLTAALLVLAATAVFAFVMRPASTPAAAAGEPRVGEPTPSPSPDPAAPHLVSASPSSTGSPSPSPAGSPSPSPSGSPSPSPSPKPSPTATHKPGPKPTPLMTAASKRAARRVGIPILVYHHISPPSGFLSSLYVSPWAFAQQMRRLHGRGYHAVTLRQVFDFWAYNTPIPRKPVVITFDDGWRTVYTGAAPALRRYHWPGVINEVVWSIDANYGMTKGMLLRLIKRGWEINSHTVSHEDLTRLSATSLAEQLRSSRHRLSRTLHTTVDFLCYPGGSYNSTVIQAVRTAGYKGALSVWGGLGRWKERWELRRIMATESGFSIPSR